MDASVSLQTLWDVFETILHRRVESHRLDIILQSNRKGEIFHILSSHTLLVFKAPHTALGLDAPIWMLVSLYENYERYLTPFLYGRVESCQVHIVL